MSSKKRKAQAGEGSSNPPPLAVEFDTVKFRSAKHAAWFSEHFRKRGIVRDKCFDLKEGEYVYFQRELADRHWTGLNNLVGVGCENIVKEFYCNAYIPDEEREEGDYLRRTSYVRGKEVSYDATLINGLLQAEEFYVPTDFEKLRKMRVEEGRLLRRLCRPGAEWVRTQDGLSKPSLLWKRDFRPKAKVWCTFVQSTLLPLAHTTQVRPLRAQLVYTIVNGGTIDIGDVISDFIYQIAHDPTLSLAYPSLITYLCTQAGVEYGNHETMIPAEPPITARMIRGYEGFYKKEFNIVESATANLHEINHPSEQSQERAERASLPVSERLARLEAGQERMIMRMTSLERSIRVIGRSLNIDPNEFPVFDDEEAGAQEAGEGSQEAELDEAEESDTQEEDQD